MNMNKFFSIFAIALLSTAAMAEPAQQSFVNSDGEYLIVESRDDNRAFVTVVATIVKAGYHPSTSGHVEPGTKSDTWCKVDVYMERQILGECYTPQMGHGISVRNHLTWTREQFKGDYSGVPVMIALLRGEHRRASSYLMGLRPGARGKCMGEPCWEEFPKK